MRPTPLPDLLGSEPFTTAGARAAGVLRARLSRTDLVHPTRAVHATTPPAGILGQAAAFRMALTEQVAFSHVTAAQLWELPLPPRLAEQTSLDVIGRTAVGQVARRGCIGHRGLESRQIGEVSGLPVVALADTWCDLGEVLRRGLTVADLVAAGDAIVTRWSSNGVCTQTDLHARLATRVRPRGKRALSEALRLVRPGVRSPMETYARLMFVQAGFPEPEINARVADQHGGWLLEGDLVWRPQRVIGEYQGVTHADRRQRSLDAARRELAEDHGWRVFEIFAEDVWIQHRRVRALLRFSRALALDPESLVIG